MQRQFNGRLLAAGSSASLGTWPAGDGDEAGEAECFGGFLQEALGAWPGGGAFAGEEPALRAAPSASPSSAEPAAASVV